MNIFAKVAANTGGLKREDVEGWINRLRELQPKMDQLREEVEKNKQPEREAEDLIGRLAKQAKTTTEKRRTGFASLWRSPSFSTNSTVWTMGRRMRTISSISAAVRARCSIGSTFSPFRSRD